MHRCDVQPRSRRKNPTGEPFGAVTVTRRGGVQSLGCPLSASIDRAPAHSIQPLTQHNRSRTPAISAMRGGHGGGGGSGDYAPLPAQLLQQEQQQHPGPSSSTSFSLTMGRPRAGGRGGGPVFHAVPFEEEVRRFFFSSGCSGLCVCVWMWIVDRPSSIPRAGC